MAAQKDKLPATPGEWTKLAKQHQVQTTVIQDFPDPASCSEIQLPQYLTLRVLVKRANIMKHVVDTEHLNRPKDLLHADADWHTYPNSTKQDMGEIFLTVASFSDDYVKYAQRLVTLTSARNLS
ncbi:hypothetical protein BBO_01306 [Beauveria brongniartii RCEF 3172]|uniref:Uncharacterized protein n=1 Tax=Beauveria brongniartii RCEF 3172 TaxID=1081107 RepID=A0A167K877_9HYPO|nr:hypothetical protein BBO_01306 [Beauveria brongniartii RCEF 3172]